MNNINVITVSVIKDQVQTYPSGCSQVIQFGAVSKGQARIVTDIADPAQCGPLYTIGDIVSANDLIPATTVLVEKVMLNNGTLIYVDKASWDANIGNWNDCCTALPTLATPLNFTTSNGDTQSVTNWDDVTNATNYVLERSLSNSFTSPTTVYSGATSGYTNTGLTNGTTYYYRVKAQAAGYNDSDWAYSSATPTA